MNEQNLLERLHSLIGLAGNNAYFMALVVLAVSFGIAKLTTILTSRLISRLTRRTKNQFDDILLELIHHPLYWTVILLGILAALSLPEFPAGFNAVTLSIVVTLLIAIWTLFSLRLLRRLLKILSSRKTQAQSIVSIQTLPLFDNLAIIVVSALSIYLIFNAWDIDMSAWLASAGIAGIAVGFAAKDTLANLFSGVFILADSPYKIGDYVVLENGERGKITHIGIRSTRMLTRDDVEITIPNATMGNTRIVNESGGPHEKYRVRVKVSVAYGSDIDQVRETLMEVATECPHVCDHPEPRVRFRHFGGSGLDFELLGWVENPELRGRVLDQLNSAVYKRFMVDGIEIPYTKQDLYIKEMPGQNIEE